MILVLVPSVSRPNSIVASAVRAAQKAGEQVAMSSVQGISLLYDNSGCVHLRCQDAQIIHPDIIFHWLGGRHARTMLDILDQAGFRLVNSVVSWRCGRNKALQLGTFERHGIPHPWTFFTYAGWPAIEREANWDGRQYVLKPQGGGRGRDVQKAADPDTANWLFSNTPGYEDGVLLQEYLDHAPKPRHHFRVNIVGGRAVRGGRLFGGANWVTNQARGGRWEEAERTEDLPRDVVELAIRAVAAIGADYSGVDVIEGQDGGYYVLETNELPGLGEETAIALGEYLVQLARERRDSHPG